MTAPEISSDEKLRKMAVMRTIARWGFVLTAILWLTAQIYAYARFREVPLVGWEFLLLALGFLVFTSKKYDDQRREIQGAGRK